MSGIGDLSVEELIAAVQQAGEDREESLRRQGRLLAALHDEHGLSWPTIAKLTGIAQATAWRRASDYLHSSDGEL